METQPLIEVCTCFKVPTFFEVLQAPHSRCRKICLEFLMTIPFFVYMIGKIQPKVRILRHKNPETKCCLYLAFWSVVSILVWKMRLANIPSTRAQYQMRPHLVFALHYQCLLCLNEACNSKLCIFGRFSSSELKIHRPENMIYKKKERPYHFAPRLGWSG